MCGLVLVIGAYQNGYTIREAAWFEHAMALNTFRGNDSTGVVVVDNKGKMDSHKVMGNAFNMLESKEYDKLRSTAISKGRFWFGHGRKATVGDKKLENAHPFVVRTFEDKKQHKQTAGIALVHNGTLERGKDNDGIEKFNVDSEWMANKILVEGAKGALESIHGAIATIWYDEMTHKLHVFRNSERPLWWMQDEQGNVFVNSEPAVIGYGKLRFNIPFKSECNMFIPHKLYTIDLDWPKQDKCWDMEDIGLPKRKAFQSWNGNKPRERFINGQWVPIPDDTDLYNTAGRSASTDLSIGNWDRFHEHMRMIVDGEIDYIDWKDGKEVIYWALKEGQTIAATISETTRLPPVYGLVHMCAASAAGKVEMELQIAGRKLTEYRAPPVRRTSVISGNTAPAILQPEPPKVTQLALPALPPREPHNRYERSRPKASDPKSIYGLPTTPKGGKVCRWHSKMEKVISGKPGTVTLNNFAFSEPNAIYHFTAYGNDNDGFFYKGQKVGMYIEYMTGGNETTESAVKYIGSLFPEDSSPNVRVEFYGKKESYKNAERLVGDVLMIRSASVREKEEEDIDVVILLGNMTNAVGMNVKLINELIEAPRKIKTIGDAMRLERKRYAA